MSKSAKQCIETNDYTEAMYRYKNAKINWKEHWWSCICSIYETCEEFIKNYILDPIKKEVVKLVKKTKAKIIDTTSNTYFIKIFNEYGNWIYNKIGKGNDLLKRLNGQKGKIYKDGNIFGNYEIIKFYNLPTDDLALVLESFMRNHFKKKYNFVPNDRFLPFEPDEEDMNTFENYYNLVINNA